MFIPWAQLCLGRIEGEWLGFYQWIPGSFGSNQPLLLLLIAILFAYKRILNRATAISYVLTFGGAQLMAGLNPSTISQPHPVSLRSFFSSLIHIQPQKVTGERSYLAY